MIVDTVTSTINVQKKKLSEMYMNQFQVQYQYVINIIIHLEYIQPLNETN